MTARIAIVGANGFLGWHTRCALDVRGIKPTAVVVRKDFTSDSQLADALHEANAILFLAGTNRGSEAEISEGNTGIAELLAGAIKRRDENINVAFANSIHVNGDSHFGQQKARAAEILHNAVDSVGGHFSDVVLPHLFGEEGRPNYNSFVATFAHALAQGVDPILENDRVLGLMHAQDAADVMIEALLHSNSEVIRPLGTDIEIGTVLIKLQDFAITYREGQIPELANEFDRNLFNTFRSAMWKVSPQFTLPRFQDERGFLGELVRSSSRQSQVFYSTTLPGSTRGNHYHRYRIERFMVIEGSGVIRLRRLFDSNVVEIPVRGSEPKAIDMPTFWAHSIENTGETPLTTLFFQDSLLDPASPDTFPTEV